MRLLIKSIFITIMILFICFFSTLFSALVVSAQNLTFNEHQIDLNFDGIHCIKIFDLDGDGDKDIVGGSEQTPQSQSKGISWWRNNGGNSTSWTRFAVDTYFDNVMSVDVAYVDIDTFPDIIATSWNLHQIAWWKNNGNPTLSWTKRTIKSSFVNAHDAKGIDINHDGFTDVVGINSTPGSVIICYHNGSDPPGWSIQTVNNFYSGGKSVLINDLDQDGDPDILGTAADANRITWWENRQGNPISWGAHLIDNNFIGSAGIDIIDMTNDGLYDIIAAAWKSNQVSYWICDDLINNQWQKTVITDQLEIAVNAVGSDFDMDGDIDVVAVGKIPGELNIYKNDNFSWSKQNLKQNFTGGTALAITDLDDDGDIDIIAGASALGRLLWWENDMINTKTTKKMIKHIEVARLFQNYPNPFNMSTRIRYKLSQNTKVVLKIYSIMGGLVRTLVNFRQNAGEQQISWDGTDDFGNQLSSGLYLCRLITGEFSETRKIVMQK